MAQRIKVAHIITRLELGGAQQNTLYCCEHHDRKKYEVLLISGVGGYLDEKARKIPDCKAYFLPELKHHIHPLWDNRALRRMAQILKDEKVDLVHTHSSKAGILGRLAAKKAGVTRVVHTVHGWGFHPRQFLPVRWFYQALERWAAKFTDVLITVSDENRQAGLAAGIGRPEQYRVIHSGIDPKQYRLSFLQARRARAKLRSKGLPAVLVLSNFKRQKSPLDVIEVANDLRSSVPYVLFLWAGDGPLFERVEAEIKSRGLERHFILLGWREDIAQLLAACDALLLTSIHEGLPRVVLQAMAAEKPVVATAVSGTPEAVKDGVTGFLHQPHDTAAMAGSLKTILTDPRLGRKMGKAGRELLRGSFLIDEMLRQIEHTYEKALVKPSKES
jgi:glycosyltransferase involved in cell wall biosynthesis